VGSHLRRKAGEFSVESTLLPNIKKTKINKIPVYISRHAIKRKKKDMYLLKATQQSLIIKSLIKINARKMYRNVSRSANLNNC